MMIEQTFPIIITKEGYSVVRLKYYNRGHLKEGYWILDTASIHSHFFDGYNKSSVLVKFDVGTYLLKSYDKIPLWLTLSGYQVVGLLGVDCMREMGLVVDYDKMQLLSASSMNLPKYVYPMEFGFKRYGVPIIGMSYHDDTRIAIIDSGSNVNITFDPNQDENVLHQVEVNTPLGSCNGEIVQNCKFALSYINDNDVNWINYDAAFIKADVRSVNELYGFLSCMPISILGNQFLVENHFVLDFHNEKIHFNMTR